MEPRGWLPAVVLGLLPSVASPAMAQEGGTGAQVSATHRNPNLTFDLTLEGRYDDNITLLSDHDKNQLSSGHPSVPSKFKIATPEDTVTLGSFQIRWRTRPFRHRETILTADEDVYRYSRNHIKNWSEFSLAFSQELSASRKHLTALRVRASYLPDYYQRELTDINASCVAGQRIRASATYSQTDYRLAIEQEVVENRMHVSLGGELESRNYNHHFDERDSDKTTWSLGVRGTPFGRSRMQTTLSYETGRLGARGDLASTPCPEDDVSYDHHGVTFEVAVPWGDRHRGRVELLAAQETRAFTTSNIYDLTHWDRVDRRRQYRARVVQRVARQFEVVADWWRYKNDPRFAVGVTLPEDETGYLDNRYTVGLRFRVSTR